MSKQHPVSPKALSLSRALAFLVIAFGCSASHSASAAGDAKLGKALHDKQCIACHISQVGGDGTRIYTRPERKIASLPALRQRVAFCSNQTNAGWFPEEEEHVTAWLNQQYYKFSK